MNEELDLSKLTAAPPRRELEPRKMHIHTLVPLDKKDIEGLQEKFNKRLASHAGGYSCVLHQWISPKCASRRDFWRLFDRVCCQDSARGFQTVFLFLGWEGWSSESYEIGMVQWWENQPAPTRRLPIELVAERWELCSFTSTSLFKKKDMQRFREPDFELIMDPDSRFFYDPPMFVGLTHGDERIPVFLLTKHLTPS